VLGSQENANTFKSQPFLVLIAIDYSAKDRSAAHNIIATRAAQV